MDTDTEMLLVMLESLLQSQNAAKFSSEQLLEALMNAEGDVERAAADLRGEGSNSSGSAVSVPNKPSSKGKKMTLRKWLIKPPSSKPAIAAARPSKRAASPALDTGNTMPIELLSDSDGEGQSGAVTSVASPTKKPKLMLTDVLRPPPSVAPAAPKLPQMTLGTPELVAQHVPCTMHAGILPPDLACRVFYRMLDESANWSKSKWYLVDKWVESPHLTSFYVRDAQAAEWHEAAIYWNNGPAPSKRPMFPPELEEACKYVEKAVNAELIKRHRYAMEWGGESGWRANVAASNRYKGANEGVGFHADQVTYLGPYPTIASLSLGTERIFRLRETIPKEERQSRAARTYNIPLPHNSLLIMHAGCQEHYKHTIPIIPSKGIDAYRPAFPRAPDMPIKTYNERINVTFRFYRPDFVPKSTPRCKCDVPMALRAQQKSQGRLDVESGKAEMRYVWMCNSGGQNEGKGCNTFRPLDMDAEGRGPCLGETPTAVKPEPDV